MAQIRHTTFQVEYQQYYCENLEKFEDGKSIRKGCAIKDFSKFFEAFADSDYLSEVKAVAMDMNASITR